MAQRIATPWLRQLQTYRDRALAAPTMLDDDLLTPAEVAAVLAQEDFQGRNRLFPPHLTIWTFLFQVLSPDGSCRDALSRLRPAMIANGQKPCSPNTGSDCKARKRLPEGAVETLARQRGQLLCDQTPEAWLWTGHPVKIVDGTTVSMADTEAHQAAYPQQGAQKPGLGCPIVRAVAFFDLACGAWTSLGIGPYQGKETGEMALFRDQQSALQRGDVMLADCYYSSYGNLAGLQSRGHDYVGRQHHGRKTDCRRGRRLGREDHIVSWSKPTKPTWMTPEAYAELPDQLSVREVRVRVRRRGVRTRVYVVVTTLLDAVRYSAQDLAGLYFERWHCALDLRSIKTMLGMAVLRCQTPEMVRKELWIYMVAYKLIRAVMMRAASRTGLCPRQLSCQGAVQAVNGFIAALIVAKGEVVVALLDGLWLSVAAHRVGNRPNRIAPRAVKRRPKPHKLLRVPRPKARRRLETGRAA